MNKEKRTFGFLNIGTASLLVVFLTLCLVSFAILSLSAAKSDYEFSKKMAQKTTAYYEEQSRLALVIESEDK